MKVTEDKKKKNLHEGHRQRLLEQIYKSGLDNMTDVQVLEFILTFFIPRKDTNELAHVLLDEFGTIKNVLDASPEELVKIEGIGERVAKLMSLLPKVFFYYKESGHKNKTIIIKNLNEAVIFLRDLYDCKTEEEFYILFFSAKQELIKFEKLSVGNQNEVSISCQDIVNKALKYKPSFIILSHNHPNGYPEPSSEDIRTTNKIIKMLYYHNLMVIDHIIIGKNDYYSFSQNNLINNFYDNAIISEDEALESNIIDKIKKAAEANKWIVQNGQNSTFPKIK